MARIKIRIIYVYHHIKLKLSCGSKQFHPFVNCSVNDLCLFHRGRVSGSGSTLITKVEATEQSAHPCPRGLCLEGQERAVVQPSREPVLSDELYLPVTAAAW